MSAYVVEREHIRFLVEAALWLGKTEPHYGPFRVSQWSEEKGGYESTLIVPDGTTGRGMISATECGRRLWEENFRSVGYRYDEPAGPEDGEGEYEHVGTSLSYSFDPAEVFQSINCLDYQSCEHPGWRTSWAKSFLRCLMESFARKVKAGPGRNPVWGAPEFPKMEARRLGWGA